MLNSKHVGYALLLELVKPMTQWFRFFRHLTWVFRDFILFHQLLWAHIPHPLSTRRACGWWFCPPLERRCYHFSYARSPQSEKPHPPLFTFKSKCAALKIWHWIPFACFSILSHEHSEKSFLMFFLQKHPVMKARNQGNRKRYTANWWP